MKTLTLFLIGSCYTLYSQDTLKFTKDDSLIFSYKEDFFNTRMYGLNINMYEKSGVYEIYADLNFNKLLTRYVSDGETRTEYGYYPNGQLLIKEISANPALVYQEVFYDNGQLYFEDTIIPYAVQQRVRYYSNGKRKIVYNNFYTTTLVGNYTEWYENGNLKVEGYYEEKSYEELRHMFVKPVKHGVWKYYSKDGVLKRTEEFVYGKLKKRRKN